MSTKANAVHVSRFINLQADHEGAGLDRRDLKYLDTPAPCKRAETAAEAYQRRTGKPYTGRFGHVSID